MCLGGNEIISKGFMVSVLTKIKSVQYLPNMSVDIPVYILSHSHTYIQKPKIKLYISRASLNLAIPETLQIFQRLNLQ